MTQKNGNDHLITSGGLKRWLKADGYEGRLSTEYVDKINARIERIIRADYGLPGNRRMLKDTL